MSAQDQALMVPPNSPQAEQGVIGGLLLDNKAWAKVSGMIRFSDFYQKRHQTLFHAISKLLSNGEPADVITVFELLERKGKSEDVGGLAYIGMLARDTPSAANIGSYAQIVRDKSTLRQMILLGREIVELATDQNADAKAALAKAEKSVFELAQMDLRGKKGFSRLRDVLREVLDTAEKNFDRPPGSVLGLSSGFRDLDGITSGFNAGDLIIVAGRPSMGKSTLAVNFGEAAAMAGKPVAMFELEMPSVQLGQRILSSASNVPMRRLRESWTLGDSDWPLLSAGMIKTQGWPFYVDETPGVSLSEIRARVMKLNMEISDDHPDGVGMIIIDYLQLMSAEVFGNKNIQIEEITRGLKRMAKEFDVPVIALSQLNRSLESRPNKRPMMSDLRDSGAIEQDADVVMFVYRDEVYNKDSADAGIAEVIIGKQRNGPTGTVRLGFEGACTRFRDLVQGEDYADRSSW
jgi:replicative DNA helicase